ncbi:MAG: hypothetical protein GY751_19550 [Bacteroidetes bacterium]|nr:hypothetical protein [Bacteroidota bacterium]
MTGDLEKLSLHKSLMQFFPIEHGNERVIWDKPRYSLSATSYRLRSLEENNSNLSSNMMSIARGMLAEAYPGRTGIPADLVIVIDDVELHNLKQEYIIAEHFRAAIEHIIQDKQYNRREEERCRDRLREKCSFHLLKPMVESYFFGDTNALRNAGVPDTEKPKLVHPTDVEQFETNDPAWLPICREINKKQHWWWYNERHPKHYLEHLIKRSSQNKELYEETNQGRKALEDIAWVQVPKCQSDAPFIRSLFEDIADWFGIQNPLGAGETNPYFYPARAVNRAALLLRNM